MTFTEIRTAIMDRLNLSSTAAQTRIGNTINDRYKRVTASLGLNTTRRTTQTETSTDGSQFITFGDGVEKIESISDSNGKVLQEVSVQEILMNYPEPETGTPSKYAIYSQTHETVTIIMDVLAQTTNFDLTATVLANVATLSGSNEPAIPESFHDILVHGGVADEARKMTKLSIAKDAEDMYERRISELRLFIASSAYKDIYPSKLRNVPRWMR